MNLIVKVPVKYERSKIICGMILQSKTNTIVAASVNDYDFPVY